MPLRKSVVLTPTHQDIFERPASSIEQIIVELRAYSYAAVINVCSKLSITLNVEQRKLIEVQARIARDLLNDEHWENVLKAERKEKKEDNRNPSIAIFHYVPVMMLLKLNLEYNTDGGEDIQTQEDREFIASWLISLNEHFTATKELGTRTFEYRKEALRMFFSQQFLLVAEPDPFAHLIARSEAMLGFVKADNRLDCEAIFKDATGLTIEEHQQLTTLLLTGWKISGKEQNLDEITVRSIHQYFSQTNVDADIVEKYITLLSFTSDSYGDLQKGYSENAKADPGHITNFLCFINKPLMRFGDNFMCVGVNYLALKLTEGVYRVVEDQLRSDDNKHNVLSQMWGDAFEKYIHDRMDNMLGKSYFKNPPAKKGIETIDGLADLKETVVLAEYKYSHWSYHARLNGNRQDMKDFYYKLFRYRPMFEKKKGRKIAKKKGLGQIRDYFEKVQAGEYTPPVDLAGKKLLPLIVSGEELPFDPLNRMYLEGFASSQHCFVKSEDALPFIVLSAEEIEILESIVDKKGVDFLEQVLTRYSLMLDTERTKTLSLPDRPTSLRNELLNENFQVPHSNFMHSQLDSVFGRAKKYFRKPTKGGNKL
jgi:hypothetical protein